MLFMKILTKIRDSFKFFNMDNSNYKTNQKGIGNTQNVNITNHVAKNGNEFTYSQRHLAAEKLVRSVNQYCSSILNLGVRGQIPKICKTRVEDVMRDFLLKLLEEDQKRFLLLIKPLLKLNKSDLNQSEDLIKKNQQEIISLLKTYTEE